MSIKQKEKTKKTKDKPSTFLESDKISSLMESLLDEVKGFHKKALEKSLSSAHDLPESSSLQNFESSLNWTVQNYDKEIKNIEKNRGRSLFFPYIGSGLGHGPYVQLKDGSIKLDLINGIGVHILGHSHKELLRASLKASFSDLVMQGNLQQNEDHLKLTNKLLELVKKKSFLEYVWITTSGSMANENALKICRQKKQGARKIITFKNAFAGRTTLMHEITDKPDLTEDLPSYDEVLRIPFFNRKDPKSSEKSLNAFKEHLSLYEGNICTFVFEPVLGEGGFRLAPREFFLPILDLCKKNSIPVWVDEVQTFCRTGEFFAYEFLDIGSFIDVCTVSKALQNGATFFTKEMLPSKAILGGTYAGSTQSLAAGYEILDFLDRGNYMGRKGKISKIYQSFVDVLFRLSRSSCKGWIRDIDGVGLMIAFTPFNGTKEEVLEMLKILFKNGLMAFFCGKDPYRIRFLLPAILEEKDIQFAGRILEKSCLEMKAKGIVDKKESE